MGDDRDLAAVAAAIGHPARAAMLSELLGGREMAAGDLSRVAQVSPSTASAHLSRLRVAGLVTEQARGRHRYHRLSSAEVAQAIEALVVLAPARRVRSLRAANRLEAERAARSCYDHLAGALGVAVTDRLVDVGALARDGLALVDPAPLVALGVYPNRPGATGVRSCARVSTGASGAPTWPGASARRCSSPFSRAAGPSGAGAAELSRSRQAGEGASRGRSTSM